MNDSNLEKGTAFRFKPGVSGNPGGRPRTRPISQRYRELMEQELPEIYRIKYGLAEGATFADGIALAMAKDALEGKPAAVREIREAIEGKAGPRQENVGQERVEFVVTYAPQLLPRRKTDEESGK
ncbi:MAG: DUF5681 domain-containing protein [Candidatus Acidiferrum sp.]